MLYTRCSTLKERNQEYVAVPRDFCGCAVWGPYQGLEAGDYSVTFGVIPLDLTQPDVVCCRIDIYADDKGEVLYEREVCVRELAALNNKIEVHFDLTEWTVLEYRVHGLGAVHMLVDAHMAAKTVAGADRRAEIIAAHKLILGRHPDMSSLRRYEQKIREEGCSIQQVREDLMLSTEFQVKYHVAKAREARLAGRVVSAASLIDVALRSQNPVSEEARKEAFAIRVERAAEVRIAAAARYSARLDELPVEIPFLGLGTTGQCNASCLHCPTGKPSTAHSPRHPMPMPLFEKIIRETAEAGLCVTGIIGLALFGDSLVDPWVVERVRLIREILPEVRIGVSTNAAAYNRAKHRALFEHVEHIKVHVESRIPERYDRLMQPLRAERVFPKIDMILEDFPGKTVIAIPVHRGNLDEAPAMRDYFVAKGAKEVAYQRLFRRSSIDSDTFGRLAIKPERFRCEGKILDHVVIDCDGAALICCNDFTRSEPLGDANTESMIDILMNARRRKMRERLNAEQHDGISTCKACHIDQFLESPGAGNGPSDTLGPEPVAAGAE